MVCIKLIHCPSRLEVYLKTKETSPMRTPPVIESDNPFNLMAPPLLTPDCVPSPGVVFGDKVLFGRSDPAAFISNSSERAYTFNKINTWNKRKEKTGWQLSDPPGSQGLSDNQGKGWIELKWPIPNSQLFSLNNILTTELCRKLESSRFARNGSGDWRISGLVFVTLK